MAVQKNKYKKQLMKGNDISVYTKNNCLVIESKIIKVREIISYNSIENIIMLHVNETYDNQMTFYLSQPIQYENIGKHFFHIILFQIYLLFHKNKLVVDVSQRNDDLYLIMNEIKKNLFSTNIPLTLDRSLYWNEESNKQNFSMIKLVYSKKGLELSEVLKKDEKLINNPIK